MAQFFKVHGDTLIAEYDFFGKPNGTTTIHPVGNTTVQSLIKTPVGMYGSSFAVNEPDFFPNGVHITHGKFLVGGTYTSIDASNR